MLYGDLCKWLWIGARVKMKCGKVDDYGRLRLCRCKCGLLLLVGLRVGGRIRFLRHAL